MDSNNQQPGYYNQFDTTISNPVEPKDQVLDVRDALTVELEDEVFVTTANKLIRQSQNFYDEVYHLKDRRKEMEKYLFGRQLNDVKLQQYRARFVDNIIYEAEAYLKPMALNKLPDITVMPGNENPVSIAVADDVSKIVTSDIQSRDRKRVLGMGFKHLPVYFTGVIKYFWNPQKGADGDYDFKAVHPENIIFDHTATTNNVADMDFAAEYIEHTVKEWVMLFPKKEKDFYKKLHDNGIFNDNPGGKNETTESGMNTKVKGVEIWFKWYQKHEDEWEVLSCVGWFYKDMVFDKIKNPNWDWEGTPQTFKVDVVNKKKVVPTQEDLDDALATGNFDNFSTETYFRNHLATPEPPYILLGYDQWGKTPLDETSRIEQNLYKQQNVDKRGAQITDMLNRSVGKHIWSVDGGLTADDLELVDMNNPDEDIVVKGDINKVHTFIPGLLPAPVMVEDLKDTRERIFSTAGVNGPVRGQIEPSTAATNSQIGREGDFTRADDLTDDTINYACEKMANAILQLIKLRYTKDHMVKVLGDDGKTVFKKINRDMIQDGMEIVISASGTDKLKAQQNAIDMAKLKLIDPLTFYKDMGMSDPKGRTEKLMSFMMMPNLYLQNYVLENGISDLAKAVSNEANPDAAMGAALANGGQAGGDQSGAQGAGAISQGGGSPQALMDIAAIQQGQVPPLPDQIDPTYLQTFKQFMDDPNGAQAVLQQFPQIKEQLMQFAKALVEHAQQMAQGDGQPAATPQQMPPQGGIPQGNVGPASTGNPSPMNTANVNITPPARS